MHSGWDFGQFPMIFDDIPDDMHRASDMRRMENLTPPLDSASPKVMEMNPMRVEPERYHTRVKPQTWSPGEVSGDSRRTAYRPHLTSSLISYTHRRTIVVDSNGGRPVTGDSHNTVI